MLAKLKELLEDDDMAATDVLDELIPLLQGHPQEAQLRRIVAAVDECNFETGLALLISIEKGSKDV